MKIIFRKKKILPGRWHDVILTPAPRAASEPLSHIMSFTLKALLPGSVYEAIVQAKNRYGWNEVRNYYTISAILLNLEFYQTSVKKSGFCSALVLVIGAL